MLLSLTTTTTVGSAPLGAACAMLSSPTCVTLTKLCTQQNQISLFLSSPAGSPGVLTTNPGNNYGCITPVFANRPSWRYFEIETSGSLNLQAIGYLPAGDSGDSDFAVWGPFSSVANAQSNCNSYGTPIYCEFRQEFLTPTISIPNAIAGQVYVLMLSSNNGFASYFTIKQLSSSTATTNCDGVPLPPPPPCTNPTPDTVTGGGAYCAGGAGVAAGVYSLSFETKSKRVIIKKIIVSPLCL